MRLPFLVILFATLAAGVMAYGVDSRWGGYSWGMSAIMLSRRLQWPLIAATLVLCFALLGLVISGKRRAWWLIGLAPVLTLFVHRFYAAPINRYAIVDSPAFVAAAEATHLGDEDAVIGVAFNGQAYAYPLSCLVRAPVIVQNDRQHRMLLLWSPRVQAGGAMVVTRELKARDIDTVSEPGGDLLVYHSRRGQFISATSGLTPAGEKPAHVIAPLDTIHCTWREWKALHPQTQMMRPIRTGS